MPKHKEKRGPPRRTDSRTTARERVKSKVYRIDICGTAREIRPQEGGYKVAFQEVATRATITTTRAIFRFTWKPTKTPSDQKRAFHAGCRDVENGINHQSRATCAYKNLVSGGEKTHDLFFTITTKEGFQLIIGSRKW